jgi:hypothetical protein
MEPTETEKHTCRNRRLPSLPQHPDGVEKWNLEGRFQGRCRADNARQCTPPHAHVTFNVRSQVTFIGSAACLYGGLAVRGESVAFAPRRARHRPRMQPDFHHGLPGALCGEAWWSIGSIAGLAARDSRSSFAMLDAMRHPHHRRGSTVSRARLAGAHPTAQSTAYAHRTRAVDHRRTQKEGECRCG